MSQQKFEKGPIVFTQMIQQSKHQFDYWSYGLGPLIRCWIIDLPSSLHYMCGENAYQIGKKEMEQVH